MGTILEVNDFPEARKPTFQLTRDFGAVIGIRKHWHKLPNDMKKKHC
jgi:tRNA-binding protein